MARKPKHTALGKELIAAMKEIAAYERDEKNPRLINVSQEGQRLMLWYSDNTKVEFKPVGFEFYNARMLAIHNAVKAIRARSEILLPGSNDHANSIPPSGS